MRTATTVLASLALLLTIGCGGGGNKGADGGGGGGDGSLNNGDGDGGGGGGSDGGQQGGADGGVIGPADCTPGTTECTDCVDNDSDGRIDGFDPECTSAFDDEEGSFATGLPGDNQATSHQDCFFDGNSGKAPNGMDTCDYATCCFYDNCTKQADIDSCTPNQGCVDFCQGATNPGCDCFGCCTMCDADGCVDVVVNQSLAPECSYDVIHDEAKCPRCTLNTDCGTPCGGDTCTLCPGQTPDDLPPDCGGTNDCPDSTTCTGDGDCGQDQYCSNGCCVDTIVVQ